MAQRTNSWPWPGPDHNRVDQRFVDATPELLSLLAAKLLKLQNGDSLIDLGAKHFSFLVELARYYKGSFLIGVEFDNFQADMPADEYWPRTVAFHSDGTKTMTLERDMTSVPPSTRFNILCLQGDMFELRNEIEEAIENRPRKIFCQPTLKMPMSGFVGSRQKAGELLKKYSIGSTPLTEWLYALQAIDLMGPEGRCVLVMPKRALVSVRGESVRRALCERGLIEAVIRIPTTILPGDQPRSLVVCSNNNEKVRFIDACFLADLDADKRSEGSYLDFSSAIEAVTSLLDKNSLNSRSVSQKDLSSCSYQMNAEELSGVEPKRGFQTRLGDICSIERGVSRRVLTPPLKHVESDLEPEAEEDDYGTLPPFFYLTQTAFDDGEIFDYQIVRKGIERYYPSKNDDSERLGFRTKDSLLFARIATSKPGVYFKVGLAEVRCDYPEDFPFPYVISDNLIALQDFNDSVNPVFLLAYLSSEYAQTQLRGIAEGATNHQLTIKDLRNMKVPVPPLDVQNKIAEDYQKHLQSLQEIEKSKKQTLADKRQLFGYSLFDLAEN
jgi:type I restriction enzyme M protein